DGSGWFGVVDLDPGEYLVATADDLGVGDAVITVTAGEVTHVELTPAAPPIEVTPADVVFTDEEGTENDTYTIPSVEGVEYLAGDDVVEAGTYPGSGTVTVTARAAEGYVLADGATTQWSHTFDATDPGPTDPPTTDPTDPPTTDPAADADADGGDATDDADGGNGTDDSGDTGTADTGGDDA